MEHKHCSSSLEESGWEHTLMDRSFDEYIQIKQEHMVIILHTLTRRAAFDTK